MSLPVQNPYTQYAGDGSEDTFAIPFEFISGSDIKVTMIDTLDNSETELSAGVDYNVSGLNVVMVIAPAASEQLVIYRRSPRSQTTSYSTTGPFLAEDHEEAMDKLAMQIQEIQAVLDTALKVSLNGLADGFNPSIVPPIVPGFIIAIDPTGLGIEFADPANFVGPQGPVGDPGPQGNPGNAGAGILRAGNAAIANTSTSVAVTFSSPTPDANYVPLFSFVNTSDLYPKFLQGMVTAKSTSGFTVTFNTDANTANYVLAWSVQDAV